MSIIYTFVTILFHLVLAFGLNALAVKFGLTKSSELFTMYFVALSLRYLYSINVFLDRMKVLQDEVNEQLMKSLMKETTKTEEKQ